MGIFLILLNRVFQVITLVSPFASLDQAWTSQPASPCLSSSPQHQCCDNSKMQLAGRAALLPVPRHHPLPYILVTLVCLPVPLPVLLSRHHLAGRAASPPVPRHHPLPYILLMPVSLHLFLCCCAGTTWQDVRRFRLSQGIVPSYKRIDTCAAEFAADTPYMYSCYDGACESNPQNTRKVGAADLTALRFHACQCLDAAQQKQTQCSREGRLDV
eukprot:1155797-Pelagomonas_calceolata.AAC.7